jgi:hypothetical protein
MAQRGDIVNGANQEKNMSMTTRQPRTFVSLLRALPALLLLLTSGCLQIETRVKVHEDGSATITERVRFTRQLLDLAGERKPELLKMLGREAVLERMKKMGQDLVLVKHELRDAEGASKESWAEFKVDHINKFRYVSPWMAYADYPENQALKFELAPLYKGGMAGNMAVNVQYLKNPRGQPAPPKDGPAPAGRTPRELQVYRDIGPIARDLLSGLRLRFTVESYAPVHSALGVRGESLGATAVDLLDISDANLDTGGEAFFENEEVALELTQLQFGGPNVAANVREFQGNETLPVFVPIGGANGWAWIHMGPIVFAPSRQLFDKHFAGKKLDYAVWSVTPPEKQTPAEFDKIGWKPREKTR